MQLTLADKIWRDHVVRSAVGEPDLLYIDLHLLHEVNTPVAFDNLRAAGRTVRRPDLTLATEDHATPTFTDRPSLDEVLRRSQMKLIRDNCAEFGIQMYPLGDARQGIVHVIGPELGLAQPGMTIVCCDSHTTTHGAFGTLAFGIGASQVEHVLATQTLPMTKMKNMSVDITGSLAPGVTPKDVVLALINKTGTGRGVGHVMEFRGPVIEAMSMEGRMTVCNMAVEAGSRAGLIAPDETTLAYLKDRPHAPKGEDWEREVAHWRTLATDPGAIFDSAVHLDGSALTPFVTWGINPAQSVPLGGRVPGVDDFTDDRGRRAAARALEYMGLTPGTAMRDLAVDAVFIGSCTNGRIEDLRAAAEVLRGRKVADGVEVLLVPGSAAVRAQAVAEGLEDVFNAAGVELRYPGCSMCCALNEDRLRPGQRAASTNNRNFEGRQGRGARTHVVSPEVAAATAVAGRLASPADLAA
ncbi:3-isopropylmalate dehydratase large subunit [Streptomyces sp. DH41]|uniref:3-isopropylmalate dehydratase large subunit n=1 Tax=Streptomyces sp. DH41 TaxID=3040125 RepID=UPI002442E4A7|nr:3-isopropylmalate dehydratase large subunit [Streptomyces sp. DH41]MDG9722872.1 3-isopropylmalate dehydratase large subunit [Streptomyces sp. DH41]